MHTKISVVVLTKNEEDNIARCLSSAKGWADEIIVVDDGSRDRTVEIARGLADRVLENKMKVEGAHRNWAYAQARNNWVLSLDADEYLSEELKKEIDAALP
ncbi:MAG: glycosyltransferase family 2 protein, partial [Candidatus Omnitrophota bacterium]